MCKKGILCIALWIVIGLALIPIGTVDAAPPAPWNRIALPEQEFEPGEGDIYEEDDDFFSASTLTETQHHTFHDWMDKDWAKFEAEKGAIYTFQTANLDPASSPDGYFVDTVLELYKSDGVTLIDVNDDYAGTNASRIKEWQAPADGAYYIKVYNFNPGFYG
jgi:hypothetical protein